MIALFPFVPCAPFPFLCVCVGVEILADVFAVIEYPRLAAGPNLLKFGG